MKRTWYAFMVAAVLTVTFAGGCGKQDAATTTQGIQAKESGAQKTTDGNHRGSKRLYVHCDRPGWSFL